MKRLLRTLAAMLRPGHAQGGHVHPRETGDIPVMLSPGGPVLDEADAATELTRHDQEHGHYEEGK